MRLFVVCLLVAAAVAVSSGARAVDGVCISGGLDAYGNRIPCNTQGPPRPAYIDPRRAEANRLNEEGRRALQEQRFNDAIDLFTRANARYANQIYRDNRRIAVLRRASAAYKARRYDEAIADYQSALAERYDDSTVRNIALARYYRAFDRAQALFDAGSYDAAIAAYQEALLYRPGDSYALGNIGSAYVRRGNQLYDQGRFDEARAAYDTALRYKPDSTAARDNLNLAQGQVERERQENNARAALPGIAANLNKQLMKKLTRPAVGNAWRQALAADSQGTKAKGAASNEEASYEAQKPFDDATALPQDLGADALRPITREAQETPAMTQARERFEALSADQKKVEEKIKTTGDLVKIAILRIERGKIESQMNMERYNYHQLRKGQGQGKVGGGAAGGAP